MELSSNSKVWVYQSDRKFTVSEKETINILCQDFIAKWAAHGTSLKSSFKVIDDYFIVLSVDENISFIDTPEDIRDKYQYFTEANMSKLLKAGYAGGFHSLEEGVKDYVQNYLEKKEYY